jgi:hypothetical protein
MVQCESAAGVGGHLRTDRAGYRPRNPSETEPVARRFNWQRRGEFRSTSSSADEAMAGYNDPMQQQGAGFNGYISLSQFRSKLGILLTEEKLPKARRSIWNKGQPK